METIINIIFAMLSTLTVMIFIIGGFVIWMVATKRGLSFAHKHPKLYKILTK